MTTYRLFIYCIFSLFCCVLQAQQPEQLQVHFDKSFYVTGEDSWYKIYVANEITDIQSKVVRVEWVAPNGQIIVQQKLKVVDNYAIGDIAIPYDWKEGNYLFRAYTLWSLNFGEQQYVQKVIPIFNLLETPAAVDAPTIDTIKETVSSYENTLQIDITSNRSTYGPRAGIELVLQVKDDLGNPVSANLSIAVTDGNYLTSMDSDEFFSIGTTPKIVTTFIKKQEAEKGIEVKGLLKNQAGELLDTRFLSLYFPRSQTFERTAIQQGQLEIQLPDFTGTQPIQLFDMNPFHSPIPLPAIEDFTLKIPYTGQPLIRTNTIANYLLLLSKYRQYREAFNMPAPEYGTSPSIDKSVLTPDKNWTMDNYTGLSDLASFASEIILGGRVVKKGNNSSIRLKYVEKSTFNKLSPWYLVNGWLTEDEPIVLKLPFREINTIALFNSKKSIATQLDPSMVSRGLLEITTKDGKTPESITQKPNNLEITGYYPVRQFPQDEITTAPDFRPTIYWNPAIQTDENGKAIIRFDCSDGIGTYQAVLVGVSKDGAMGTAIRSYKVDFK